VTAARNEVRFIERAIESTRAQTFSDWEHIIVDDASDDGTVEVVEALRRRDPRIRLLPRISPGGSYRAAMDGIRAADGRYIARLDADDLSTPWRLATQLETLASTPGTRACTGAWRSIDEDEATLGPVRIVATHSNQVLKWRLCLESGLVHSSMLIERDAMLELGGYRSRAVAEDYRIWCQLARRGWLAVTDELVVAYRVHQDQIVAQPGAGDDPLRAEVRQEHVEALTLARWRREDVRALRRIGSPSDPDRAAASAHALHRWASAWRGDRGLGPAAVVELDALTRTLALRHLKWNWRHLRGPELLALTRAIRAEVDRTKLRDPP